MEDQINEVDAIFFLCYTTDYGTMKRQRNSNSNSNNNVNVITLSKIPRTRRLLLGLPPVQRAYDVHSLANLVTHHLYGPVNEYGRSQYIRHPHNPAARLTNADINRILNHARSTGWEPQYTNVQKKIMKIQDLTRILNAKIRQYCRQQSIARTRDESVEHAVQFFTRDLPQGFAVMIINRPRSGVHECDDVNNGDCYDDTLILDIAAKLSRTMTAHVELHIYRKSVRVFSTYLKGQYLEVLSEAVDSRHVNNNNNDIVKWFHYVFDIYVSSNDKSASLKYDSTPRQRAVLTDSVKRGAERDMKEMLSLFPNSRPLHDADDYMHYRFFAVI